MSSAGDLEGRVCLVTGASSGIGRETARGLASRGATVILLGRSAETLEAAKQDIARTTRNHTLETLVCDLSSQRAIRQAAATMASRHARLHVLVNNAGVITRTRSVTEDGIETQLAVNHLAPFLLTHLLLPLLTAAAPARIVIVASAVESLGRIDFADLSGEQRYDPNVAYCQSKLANVLFTYELAHRLSAAEITANCLHPGAVATGLLAEYFGYGRAWARVARLKYASPLRGAETSVYLASSPDVASVTGRYFDDCRPRESSPQSMDAAVRTRLWSVSEQLVQLSAQERLGTGAGA